MAERIFTRCKRRIDKGLKTFIDVGEALLEIRDARLYRAEHATFEEYCRARWGIERRHAYRLIDAASVVQNVSHGTHALPSSERQARPLARLEPEEQREAWARECLRANNIKKAGPVNNIGPALLMKLIACYADM